MRFHSGLSSPAGRPPATLDRVGLDARFARAVLRDEHQRSALRTRQSGGLVGRAGTRLATALGLLLLWSGSAQAAGTPPQCSAPPSPLQVEVGDPPSFAGSCFDQEGDTLTITITEQPQKGTADVVTGLPPFVSVLYSATLVGADSFKFKASDGSSDSNEVTVTTDNLPAVNDPPQCSAFPSPLQVEVGDPPSFAGSCSDEEGGALTITITELPQRGTAAGVTEGVPPVTSVQYSASSVGADGFKFKASDGSSDSNEVTVTTDNLPQINDPPECSGPFVPVLEVEVGNLPSFAGECFDDEGANLTITITQPPQKGTVEVVSQDSPPFTSVRYRASSEGADSFTFKASDGNSDSDEVTVTTNNLPAVADPPQCGGLQQVQVEVGEPGSGFPCLDAEGDDLTLTITQPPQKGTLEIVDQGTPRPSLRYTATSVGPDSFSYKASDGSSDSNEATTTTVNVDTKAPDTTVTEGPSGATSDSTPTFSFASSEPGTFQCSVDGGAFAACNSPITLAPLADGPHTFRVRAADMAGNVDSSPAGRDFTVMPPVSPPGSMPADVVAPAIVLGGKTTQRLSRSITLVVEATNEDLWASLSGTLAVPGASRIYKLTGVKNRFIARGSRVTLKVKLSTAARAAIKRALRRNRKVKATLSLSVRDAVGNRAVTKRAVRLKL